MSGLPGNTSTSPVIRSSSGGEIPPSFAWLVTPAETVTGEYFPRRGDIIEPAYSQTLETTSIASMSPPPGIALLAGAIGEPPAAGEPWWW